MVVDAVRTYLDAANGLTELSRKQAVAAAKSLLRADGSVVPAAGDTDGPPPRVGQNIQALAGELIETSQANRAAIADLVRAEVGRALEQMDVVPRAEYDRVVRRVAELERRMAARHAVERVLTPRGGASSVLPVPQSVVEVRGEESAAPGTRLPRDEGAHTRAEEDGLAEGAGTQKADESETARKGHPQGGEGVGDTAEEAGPKAEDANGPRPKGRTGAAKGTVNKTTRPRAAGKRTTKGKNAKK